MKLYFIAPEETQIKQDILDHLEEKNVSYELANSTQSFLSKVNVLYQTRIPRERLLNQDMDLSPFYIDSASLQKMKSDSIVMHPLPRSVEINPVIDTDPRAAYFRQAQNGLFVRMALLTMLFDTD